jgi:hypothetical protein
MKAKVWLFSGQKQRYLIQENLYRLWRWYINITVTVLDIIHRPVFYLKLNLNL